MEFKQIHSLEIKSFSATVDLISKFISDGNEQEAKVCDIFNEMRENFNPKTGFVFSIEGDGKILGLLSVSKVKLHGRSEVAFVHFISTASSVGIQRTQRFIEFAIDEIKKSGIENIMFNTRRNADAFIRFLPRKWEKDSVTLKLCAA